MDLGSRYHRTGSARSPRRERDAAAAAALARSGGRTATAAAAQGSERSPGRSSPESRRSPQRRAAASRLYQQDTAASRGRLLSRETSRSHSRSRSGSRSRSRSGSPSPVGSRKTAAEALLDAIEDSSTRLDGRRFHDVRDFFELVDTRGNGAITPSELRSAVERLDLGIGRSDLRACYDIGKGSTIELPELERWLQKGRGAQRSSPTRRRRSSDSARASKVLARRLSQSVPENVAAAIALHRVKVENAFVRFDSRGTGSLSSAAFRKCLERPPLSGTVLTRPQVKLLMSELDKDRDGRVDYCEFVSEAVRISEVISDTTDSDFTDDTHERGRPRRRSNSTDAGSVYRFARHGLAVHEDEDSSDEIIADLQRQVRVLRDQRDDYMQSRTPTSLSGKARARQLRSRMKAGRLQGVRQVSTLFWAFTKWKQITAVKTREEAARAFSGQWHIKGRDHDDQDVEEWLVLWVGRAGDIHGEFLARASADHVATQSSVFKSGDIAGRRLRFTQVYPHSAQRTRWELTTGGGRGQLSGTWTGDAEGEFTAERCQIWVDSCDPQPQTSPRALYNDSPRRTHSGSPSAGRGRSSPKQLKKAARRLAHVVTEDIVDTMYENRMSLASTFHRMDKGRSGSLSSAEFREGLHLLTGTVLTKPQVRLLMSELDKDGDGRVDYEELLAAVSRATDARRLARNVTEELRQRIRLNRQSLLETFGDFDTNGDGVLSAREVQRGLQARGIKLLSPEIDQLMQVVDTDGNGTLDYCEFVEAAVHLGSDSADEADIGDNATIDIRERRRSPPRLTVRSPTADDDSPRSTGSPRQRSAGRSGTPALINAIAKRLDEIDGWQTKHLFRQLNRSHTAFSEAHALLEQLEGERAMASFAISHKVVAQTVDSRTLTALLYAWLLELHDSPIPKTMFQECKIISERPQHARTALMQLVKDIPDPGQSILRAVIALYRVHDPDASDTVAIDNGLAPALMHSPQGAEQKWNHGDFIAVLVRELPDPSDFGHGQQDGSGSASPRGVPRQRRSPFSQAPARKAQRSPTRRQKPQSPGKTESMFSSCPGRPNSGDDGNDRSRRRGRSSPSRFSPFGPPRVTGTGYSA
jgi:Ca2+-binding EF-hand superfamily protein